MTMDEADRIIAELSLVFPAKKLTVEEVFRWEENLEPYQYERARETVKMLERSSRFFPTWAEFYSTIQPLSLRFNAANQAKELEAARSADDEPCSVEENLAQIAKIRAMMAKRFSG